MKKFKVLIIFLFLFISTISFSNNLTLTNPEKASIQVIIMGEGDELFARFGHIAIRIKDKDFDLVFNYGMFNAYMPPLELVNKFVKGELKYWLAVTPFDKTFDFYKKCNRNFVTMELNLSPEKKNELFNLLMENSNEEHKYYKYHHFYDNCSTRVVEIINKLLDGQVKKQFLNVTNKSYRDHVQEILFDQWGLKFAIDLLLSYEIDKKITQWEQMFLPMYVEKYLPDATYVDSNGQTVKLISNVETLYKSTPFNFSSMNSINIIFSILIGILLLIIIIPFISLNSPAMKRMMDIGTRLWGLIFFGLSCFIIFILIYADHSGLAGNNNLFVFLITDLLLTIGIFIKKRNSQLGLRIIIWYNAFKCIFLGIVILLKVFGILTQANGHFIIIALSVHLLILIAYSYYMTNRKELSMDIFVTSMRLILGGVFIIASIDKISNPFQFAMDISNYDMLPLGVINLMAIIMPWIELITGIMIIIGLWTRANVIIINGMLIVFIIAISVAVLRGINIYCGCGLSAEEVVGLGKIIEDSFMLIAGIIIYAFPLQRTSLDKIFVK